MNLTAPSHKLDCFLHEMLLIRDSYIHKIKFARTFKIVFSLRDLGLENIFSVIIKRLLIFISIFSIPTFRGAFFCIYNGCLN